MTQAEKYLIFLRNNDFELMEKYKGTKKNVAHRCLKCGEIEVVRPDTFKTRSRKCRICTYSKYALRYEQLTMTHNIKINISEYKNFETAIVHKCLNCETSFLNTPQTFQRKREKCNHCTKKKKSQESFSRFYDYVSSLEDYQMTDKIPFVNYSSYVEMEHLLCNHKWKVVPKNFETRKSRCPKCNGNIRKTLEQFKREVFYQVGVEYTVISDEYINTHTHVKIRHNLCGNKYNVTPNSFLGGKRCNPCAQKEATKKRTKTHETFISEVFEKVGNEYKVLGRYTRIMNHVLMKHMVCGHEWEVEANAFLRGSRCPKCNESKGEKRVSLYLDNHRIEYITQYRFIDCRYKNPLPFDFALFDKESNLKLLIEYDGEQHYHSVEYFGGEDSFLEVQQNDSIKNEYCIDNKIPLIRIPYWEFDNIEDILDNIILNKDNGINGDSFFI